MANEKKITMTQEGYNDLVKELEWRKGEERERIKNDIVVARGFGDLSENAEYDAARNAQAENEARIQQLTHDIEHAVVLDTASLVKGIINIGTTVKAVDEKSGREMTFRIVGSNEADVTQGKISDLSPVGRALMGHKAGDVVTDTVEVSGFTFSYRIVEVTQD